MRPSFIAVVLGILGTGLAGFLGGEWWAKYEAKRNAETAIYWSSSAQSAQSLFIFRRAIDALSAGKPKEAEAVLIRYAKLQVPKLSECSKAPQCSAWVGSFMPTNEQLREIEALKEVP